MPISNAGTCIALYDDDSSRDRAGAVSNLPEASVRRKSSHFVILADDCQQLLDSDCNNTVLQVVVCGQRWFWRCAYSEFAMAPKNNPGSKSAADNMTPEQLERALYVPPPPDPQQLEEHVRQLLMRAQVSWLPKRDILDILTNWREYSLPISLMPPDQPGRAALLLKRA